MTSVSEMTRNVLIGFTVFLVLPLVAWGWDDLPGFYEHNSRQGWVAVIVVLQIFQLLDLWKREAISDVPSGKSVERRPAALMLLRLIPLILVTLAPFCDRRDLAVMPVEPWVRNCGLIMFALGMILMHEAEKTANRVFSVQSAIQREYRLEVAGVYRHLRHPMDLGVITVTLGTAVAFRSWTGLILVGVLILLLISCIRREERVMAELWGEDWAYYINHTSRLIPLVPEEIGKVPALRSLLKLLVGLVIFIGIPLLAWGVTDFSGFTESMARRTYLVIASLIPLIVALTVPNVGAGSTLGRKTVARQRLALVLLQIISLAIVAASPYGDHRNFGVFDESTVVRVMGLALFVGGMGLMHWAEATLGRLFSVQVTVQEDHHLVVDGPYLILRHPRYLGIILFSAGLSLTFRSWLGLILAGALVLVLLWRIHDEEQLMHEEFRSDWEAYCRVTWRLIPFIF